MNILSSAENSARGVRKDCLALTILDIRLADVLSPNDWLESAELTVPVARF